MAAADGSIIIEVRANTQQATSALTKLAKLAVTAFAVDKIIDFSKQAIQLGSDVAEVQNVVDVAFGDMSSAVDEFAQNAITNFGMSELDGLCIYGNGKQYGLVASRGGRDVLDTHRPYR